MARVGVRFDGVSTGARKAAAETRAAVKSVGDQADRDTKRISLLGPALRRTLQLATLGLTAFAAASVIAFKKSVDAASNLEEQINKARVVFRGAEQEVIRWSETTARSIGISQRAALEFAGTFGNMLVPMGFARDEAAKMSMQLVTLAADMASFNNASPEETLEALRAGLAGETEPLRRFGIFLNEARIRQEALNAGLVKGKDDLTAAGKAAAIYRIILKDTSDSQGDFARTSDSVANSQRTFRALLEDTAARIGRAFLPAVRGAMNAMNDWLQDEDNQRRLEEWAETLTDGVGAALEAIADFIRTNGPGIVDFFKDAADTIRDVADAADEVAEKVGGWDEVFKLAAIIASVNRLKGVAAAAGAGSGLLGAAGAAGLLRSRLVALSKLGVIAIAIRLLVDGSELDRLVSWLEDRTGNKGIFSTSLGDIVGGALGAAQSDAKGGEWYWDGYAWKRKAGTPGRPAGVGDSAADKAGAATTARGGIQLTTSQKITHETRGLGGFPAKDWFAVPGTPVRAPENGRVVRHSGSGGTSGQVYGWSLYYVGDETGNTYFITHLTANRAPLGRYKKGDVLGFVSAWDGGAPHAHVGIRKGAVAVPTPTSDLDPIETSAVTSDVGASSSSAAKKATIDPRDLAGARSSARFINRHLEDIASPTLRARIRQRGLAIANALADVTDPKEFSRVRRNLNALERDFEKAVELTAATKQARATARSIASALANMPDQVQRELGPKVARLNRELGNVTSKRQLDRIKTDLQKIRAAIDAELDRMRETIERGNDTLGRALGRAADKALQVLDAKTEQLLRKARVLISGESLGEGDLGPAGRALAAFRAARDAEERARSRAEALAGAETPEERARLEAQHALEDQERALEQAARLEEEQITAALDRERERIRDEREIVRERFQERYDEIVRGFQNETLTAEQAQQALIDLLNDPQWAADFAAAGELVGLAFANSLTAVMDGVAAAVDELTAAVRELADATGVPMPGESAAQRALRLRSQALNEKYGLGAGAAKYVSGAGALTTAAGAAAPGTSPATAPPVLAVFNWDGHEVARVLAQPMSDEQSRLISYRSYPV